MSRSGGTNFAAFLSLFLLMLQMLHGRCNRIMIILLVKIKRGKSYIFSK